MFHEAMEAWFGDELGMSYDEVIVARKVGFPAVHTEGDFARPTAFGETIAVEMRLLEIGRSSIKLAYRIRGEAADDERGRGATTCAAMDLDPASARFRKSMPVPDDIRAAMERFISAS